MSEPLTSVEAVVSALGGDKAVAECFDVSVQAVSNWKALGFPPNTYIAISEMLAGRGLSAHASLWPRMLDWRMPRPRIRRKRAKSTAKANPDVTLSDNVAAVEVAP